MEEHRPRGRIERGLADVDVNRHGLGDETARARG
jgi:hypothetical protein